MDRARQRLLAARHVYIVCHITPDGDAIGSLLGMGTALQKLGKTCTLACPDPLSAKLAFLPSARQVISDPPTDQDTIVTVDVSDIGRLGSAYVAETFRSRPVINIDHHVTNTRFGSINLIRPLPSTAEVVLGLVRRLGVPLDTDIASALLMGLITDTRCFRTGNVTTRQLRTAIALMNAGAPLADLTEHLFNCEPLSTVRLWGQALAAVQTRDGVIWAEISQEMMRRSAATPSDADGLSSFLASTAGMDGALVFREQEDGRIEVSMRAGPGHDLSGVAVALGGGGHARAAGCTVDGPMNRARVRVLDAVVNALRGEAAPGRPEAGALGPPGQAGGA
jgi:phosphoesterase RecJ-like protein